jgi:hypothetical protein
MKAEYIGEKWICRLLDGEVHVAEPPLDEEPPPLLLAPPLLEPPPPLPFELELEHAPSATAAPHRPTRTALSTPGPKARLRMRPPRLDSAWVRGSGHMHVPPPAPATNELAQKVNDPPSPPNVQHCV